MVSLAPRERRAWDNPGAKPREAGFTLVEMAVAMMIFGIFLALAVGAMIHLVTPTLQTEAMRDSSDSLNIAFLDMDSEVRYASEIWAPYPGTPASDDTWDLLFESTFTGGTTPTCTELQYDWNLGELSQATWAQTSTTDPGYKILASGLTGPKGATGSYDPWQPLNDTTPSPFTEQQLEVTLYATSGSGGARELTSSQVTFTALNSTTNSYSAASPQSSGGCLTTWAAE